AAAQEDARRRGNPEIYPEHLLLALLDQELFADWQGVRADAEQKLAARPSASGAQTMPQTSTSFREVLDRADRERAQLEDDYISTEHLFLALEPMPRDEILAWIRKVRGGQRVTTQDPEGTYQALAKFGRDLTEEAEQGKLDPVIGRDEEIRRVIQILSRRTKNNPVLIGEPGVGATALDEYRKHIEKDAALERRFAPVFVDEPTVEDTIAILRGLKERYEAHHGVRIRDAALVAAAVLSNRYIADRFLPDKAIDL